MKFWITTFNSKKTNPLFLLLLIITSIAFVSLIFFWGETTAVLAVSTLYVPAIILLILIFPDFGFILFFIYSGLFWVLTRHFLYNYLPFPPGTTIDVLLLLVQVAYLIRYNDRIKVKYYSSPIAIALFIYLFYLIFQVGNPNSSFQGWAQGIRISLRLFLLVSISIYFFSSKANIKLLINAWLLICLLNVLFASYEVLFGIPRYEMDYAFNTKDFAQLNYINGKWRIWSLMQSSTDFGLLMTSSGMFFLVYANRFKSGGKKIFFYCCAIFMLILNAYSGTRTSIAITVIGFIFFILFNIHKIEYILLTFLVSFVFIIIIFGPIYTPTAIRIRSTFFPQEDASFQVREINQHRMRPYFLSNPIGGGLNSLHTPGHLLNGFPPDSFYVAIILEQGIVGVILVFHLFIATIWTGLYILKKTKQKSLIKAFLVFFYMLSIAGYTQENVYQFPYGVIFWGTLGFFIVEYVNSKSS